jgi:transmembrane 9 superfamily protein 2/4
MIAAAALVLLAAASASRAAATVYLPGVAPNAFKDDERVILKANKVTSTKSQVPYDYYDLPFCKGKRSHAKADNVGERLSGDTTTNSPYELSMKKDERCAVLCRRSYKKSDMAMFRRMIDEEYRVHWLLDSLPVAVRNDELGFVSRGYPIGFSEKKGKHSRHYLYNHVSIIIRYNENPEAFEGARIVGFEVVPYSIKHEYDSPQKDFNKALTPLKTCGQLAAGQPGASSSSFQAVDSPDEVIFTYDVKWEPSTVTWENRWDTYLRGNPDDEIHYFSIINSLMIVLFLTGVVTMIMLRTLRKDITAYNEIQTLEEAQEESGWKLVHGDVFRPPAASPMVLAVLAGTGLQLLAMTFVTIVCAYLGLVSPQNRGTLLTALVLIFVFMGSVAGYASSRVYKLFNGKDWKQCTLLTATLFPSIVAVIFLGINAFVASQGSSAAAPFLTLLTVLFLWIGVSTPLVFIGSYFGFKKETISVPVRTNQIVRLIPDQVWYTHPFFAVALGGVLPFGAVCIELFFIMSALWLHQVIIAIVKITPF